jgi:hypothetical protein
MSQSEATMSNVPSKTRSLVERLRKVQWSVASPPGEVGQLCADAADEIERLRAALRNALYCEDPTAPDPHCACEVDGCMVRCQKTQQAIAEFHALGLSFETSAKPVPWHSFPCGAEFPDRASAEEHWKSAHNQLPKEGQ